jgi:hypothetical protein
MRSFTSKLVLCNVVDMMGERELVLCSMAARSGRESDAGLYRVAADSAVVLPV